jgi:hypothetical protein
MEDKYVVIGKWINESGEPDWDIISSEPMSFERATEIKISARETWISNQISKVIGEQNLTNVELVITTDELQNLLNQDK